jgi:hypothetical protein
MAVSIGTWSWFLSTGACDTSRTSFPLFLFGPSFSNIEGPKKEKGPDDRTSGIKFLFKACISAFHSQSRLKKEKFVGATI